MNIEPLNQWPATMVWGAVDRAIVLAEYDPELLTEQTMDEILMVWLVLMAPAGRA